MIQLAMAVAEDTEELGREEQSLRFSHATGVECLKDKKTAVAAVFLVSCFFFHPFPHFTSTIPATLRPRIRTSASCYDAAR